MSKSLTKLALAGALTLALSGALTGLAEARGGGGGGGGGGAGPEANATNAAVVPTRRPYVTPSIAGPDGCHYHSYWGIICEPRGGRR